MVINDRHRFIFIHVPKSAGTSMMRAFQELPGNNRRWIAVSNHEPIRDFHEHWPGRRSLFDRILNRNPVGYLTFAFVRNPWDRLASLYRYLTEKKRRKPGVSGLTSFADFLDQAAQRVAWINGLHSFRNQVDFFRDAEGRMAIDFAGRLRASGGRCQGARRSSGRADSPATPQSVLARWPRLSLRLFRSTRGIRAGAIHTGCR